MAEENKEENGTKISEEELHFLSLVYSLTQAAWSWMGKQANPVTQQTQIDLVQAKAMIDMLRIIQKKTAGNLTAKEQGILDGILSDLELNYVEESSKTR
jgi:hypothetical protein